MLNKKYSLGTSCVIALVIGALLPFAFAPFNIWVIAFIPPIFLWLLIRNRSPRKAALITLCFGLSFFGVGVSWIAVSVQEFGGANIWVSLLLTFLFVFTLSLFIVVPMVLYRKFFNHTPLRYRLFLVFPSLWVLSEWCRNWVMTGFPWLFLGTSQLHTWLNGYAPIGGVYLVSLVIIWISAGFIYALHAKRHIPMALATTIVFILGGFALQKIQWTHPDEAPLSVTLIQGNISEWEKWNPERTYEILNRYQNATQMHWNSELIVWPEAAIPTYADEVPNFLSDLDEEAEAHHSTVVFGVLTRKDDHPYNTLMAVGQGHGQYSKQHLVPFGEYLPLPVLFRPILDMLHIPMSDFAAASQSQQIKLNHRSLAGFLCYEIAYPELVRDSLGNASLIVVASDDSWFGKRSFAATQQLQMAQMRAVELQRPVLYATNTGITALIDHRGRILKTIPRDQYAILTGTIQPQTGLTLWAKTGEIPLLTLLALFLLIGILRKK